MKTVDKIVEELYIQGIDTYFIMTGGVICPFVDAVGRNSNVKYYCFQHEQAAAMAAEGYYKACGKIAAVLVTSGPGAQNLLNGICGCWYDSVPVLFITGQVNTKESLESIQAKPRQLGFQETPVVCMFEHCTLYSKKITSSAEISNVFSKAISKMNNGRKGPVHIDFPIDIQLESCIDADISIKPMIKIREPHFDIPSLSQFKRPLVVIGAGARNCEIEKWLNVPFISSWGGFDVVKNNNLFVGNHGIYGDRVANFALQNADLLIILGSRMDTRQTGSNTKACSPKSFKVMVDVDDQEIQKLNERGFKIDVPVIDTVSNFIQNIYLNCECSEWVETINMWKHEFGEEKRDGKVYDLLKNLELPEKCIIIPDIGGNMVLTFQSIKLKEGQNLFTNVGNASMGCSIPMAIGASLARPGVPIISINGDGGIMMNIQELETIRHLKLPITIIVLNNAGHGIIRQFQDSYFESRYTATSSNDVYCESSGINLANIARGFGIESYKNGDVTIKKTPVFYDIDIDPNQKFSPKMEFGSTLENMAPKRPELLKFMLD
jgi:acetolactate synthase-1/2/3 large subunit